MNKNKIMQEYVQNFLTDRFLAFQSVEMYPGARSIVPVSGDYLVSQDILGTMHKQYLFSFIGVETLDPGTNYNNAEISDKFEEFNDWIVTQENNHNYPDFGENCKNYSIQPLNNLAGPVLVDEQGNAKYILSAVLYYDEEEI